MKAAVYDHNGPPEVLRYTDVPDPKIRSRDVLIQVEAISVEGGDLINRRSSPPGHPAYVVGYAAAGTVVAIGDAVTDRKPGDRVTSWGLDGSHAQLRAVPTDQTWLLPAGAGVAEAAAIPIGFGTAHHCLFARGRLSSGSSVLIQGAAGGVGVAAVQLARQAGATVIAVASGEDRVRSVIELGASRVIDHNVESVVDVVRVPERNGRPTAPRLHPRLGARFEHRKNVVGDGLINVDPVRFLSHFPHSFRRSRCLRPAALTRWRSAGWGGGSKIDGSGAGGATREAPARASAPELAELVGQPGPVDYASGTKGRVPLVFPRWQLPPLTERGPGPLDPMWQLTDYEARGPGRSFWRRLA